MAGKSLNKVQLIGNLGKDPELRYTQNGTAVATLTLATNEREKVGEQWQDRTEWHRIVLWGRQAEVAGEYLNKGSKCYIEGRLQTRKWTDNQNVERYTTEVVGHDLILLGGRGESSGGGGGYPPHPADMMEAPVSTGPSQETSPQQAAPTHTGSSAAPNTVNEPPADDIPF